MYRYAVITDYYYILSIYCYVLLSLLPLLSLLSCIIKSLFVRHLIIIIIIIILLLVVLLVLLLVYYYYQYYYY